MNIYAHWASVSSALLYSFKFLYLEQISYQPNQNLEIKILSNEN
jgi:hypothetical protein